MPHSSAWFRRTPDSPSGLCCYWFPPTPRDCGSRWHWLGLVTASVCFRPLYYYACLVVVALWRALYLSRPDVGEFHFCTYLVLTSVHSSVGRDDCWARRLLSADLCTYFLLSETIVECDMFRRQALPLQERCARSLLFEAGD